MRNYIEISEGALNKLPFLIEGYKSICVVADRNTYDAAGERVEKLLKSAGVTVRVALLDRFFILADETSVGDIFMNSHRSSEENTLSSPELFIAIGAGTIIDTMKFVSSRMGIPFGICLTALSVSTCLSEKCHIVRKCRKEILSAQCAKFVLADIDVIKKAPEEMLFSGLGEAVCTYSKAIDADVDKIAFGSIDDEVVDSLVCKANNCFDIAKMPQKLKSEDVKLLLEMLSEISSESRNLFSTAENLAFWWENIHIKEGSKPMPWGLYLLEATVLMGFMCKLLYKYGENQNVISFAEKYISFAERVEKMCVALKVPFGITEFHKMIGGVNTTFEKCKGRGILGFLNENDCLDFVTERACVMLAKFIEDNNLEAKIE